MQRSLRKFSPVPCLVLQRETYRSLINLGGGVSVIYGLICEMMVKSPRRSGECSIS